MKGSSAQIKVTIPTRLQDFLQSKASKYGLSLSAYIRNLIIEDVKEMDVPVYQASRKVQEAYQEAKMAERKGELTKVKDIKTFLDEL